MLDDYTKAEFPLDLPWNYGTARLLASFGDRVIGAVLREDGSMAQAVMWDGQGIFGDGKHPEMDLPPPPAMRESRIIAMQDEIAGLRDRLNSFPDAPPEWRAQDEEKIGKLEKLLAKLKGDE